MNDKLVALALIRASITEDLDVLQVMLREHPPTPALVSQLIALCAGILEHGIGRERAVETIDGWLRAVLQETTK